MYRRSLAAGVSLAVRNTHCWDHSTLEHVKGLSGIAGSASTLVLVARDERQH